MEFSIREWRRMYFKIQELGKILKDSYPDGPDALYAKHPLSENAQIRISHQINELIATVRHYMDKSGALMPKPLWQYNKRDPSTWASDPSFKYGHLYGTQNHEV
jgi:hypothetical protein